MFLSDALHTVYTVSVITPVQGVLGYIKEQADQLEGSRQETMFLLGLSSCIQVPVLSSYPDFTL